MDESTGIIAVVPDDWQEMRTVRHQVVRRLARYYPTIWLNPTPNWRRFLTPGSPDFLAVDRWDAVRPGLDVFSAGLRHPAFYRPRALRLHSLASRLRSARARLLARGARSIVLYIWRDEFADALDLVKHDVSIYHIDDEYTFSDLDLPNTPRELEILHRVDQVIVHSRALLVKKGPENANTVLVPNGVDYQAFSVATAEPADLAVVPRPRAGYIGVIKKQIALDLLARLARSRPDVAWVLIGPVGNVAGKEPALDVLRALPNVHFLGSKPADALGAYAQHLDVCLMPYEVNGYTRYICPLKLHEYLASGRPVVATPVDAVIPFGTVVALARTDAEWLSAIDEAVAGLQDSAQEVARRQAVARSHDWDVLVQRIADVFRAAIARSRAA